MQREIVYDTLETFLDGLRGHAIKQIAFSETSETRPEQVRPGVLQVTHVNRVELIAYRDSVIYKCAINDIDHDSLYARLTAKGFEVTRRSRNIT